MSNLTVTSPTGAPTARETRVIRRRSRPLRVGDADKNVRGVQTYVVSYHLAGVINRFADHDEFYWNAIGPGWNVTVWNGVVQVTGPAAPTRTTCFCGPSAPRPSATPPTSATVSPASSNRAFRRARRSPWPSPTPPSSFTTAPRYYEERWSIDRAFTRNAITVGGAGVLLAVVVGGVAVLGYSVGRDRKAVGSPTDVAFATPGTPGVRVGLLDNESSPVDFAPPDNIRPAQFGLVRNEEVRNSDVAATIVDLAVRGYLRIEEVGEKKRHPDYRLVRLREAGRHVAPVREHLARVAVHGSERRPAV